MTLQPGTTKQLPDHSILDAVNKQTYLGNEYVYCASNAITGSSETVLYLLKNPVVTASGFPSGYISLFYNLSKLITATDANSCTLRVYLGPTSSASGTAKTPVNLRPKSTNTSIATLGLTPTVSANGTLIDMITSQSFAQTSSNVMTILDPGKSLLITVQCNTDSTVITQMRWYEI